MSKRLIKAPMKAHMHTIRLPMGCCGVERYPSILEMGFGSRWRCGRGTKGLRYSSISKSNRDTESEDNGIFGNRPCADAHYLHSFCVYYIKTNRKEEEMTL